MDFNKFDKWFHLFSSIAILFGIVLVVVELRQAKDLAHAQLTSDSFSLRASQLLAIMGENPSAVVTKSCTDPDSMTLEDTLILEHLNNYLVLQVIRGKELNEVADLGIPWREQARNFGGLMNTHHGQEWWLMMRSRYDAEIVTLGNAVLEQTDPNLCKQYLTSFKDLEIMREKGD